MITINNLSLRFGGKELFKDVSVRVNGNDRIGLVGVNGAGKSTLLQVLAGCAEADCGEVARAKGTTAAYLPQDVASFVPHRTVYEEAETAFRRTLELQEELREVNFGLASCAPDREGYGDLLRRQGELQHRLDQADVFRIRPQIEKVLTGLGFQMEDLGRPCETFSGGWLMRLMLSRLLLAAPSLLLLDEPTNHLDIESLMWLEAFLKAYRGAIVVVSHDRAFLDNLTTTTWELSRGRLTVYRGNYSHYVVERDGRLRILRAAHANQQAQIQQTMRFVERFRAKSTKASQVQSRLKQLEKMEAVELDGDERQVSFRFPAAVPSGRLALECTGLCKGYGRRSVLRDVSFRVQRGDKLAVVGVNGAGKSTLARLLGGLEKPDGGEIRFGHNVKPSYFGQHQAQELDPDLTVFETLTLAARDMTMTEIRSLLGAFLFSGEEVDKQVRVLSGGEKSRLALARMISTPANLLIMDEPTNHLDMASQEVLRDAMARYDGTIVVVSHNRYFLNGFVKSVLEIRRGRATLFPGDLDNYLRQVRNTAVVDCRDGDDPTLQAVMEEEKVPRGKETRRRQAMARQARIRLLAPFREEIVRAEAEIGGLELRKAEIESSMAVPERLGDPETLLGLSREYQEIDRRLTALYRDWEEAQEKIQQIEAASPPGD